MTKTLRDLFFGNLVTHERPIDKKGRYYIAACAAKIKAEAFEELPKSPLNWNANLILLAFDWQLTCGWRLQFLATTTRIGHCWGNR